MTQTRTIRRHPGLARRAFTLIEVMIVIAIILALSALVGVALFSRQKEAKSSLAQIDMNTIKKGLQQFYLDYDRFPTDEEGLAVLWSKESLSAEGDQGKWKKYLEEPMPNDRWGRAWGYRQTSEHGDDTKYDLWSFGPDGQEGTDDDITSWPKEGSESGAAPTSTGSTSTSGTKGG
jgi:general secretion pathway protein G